MTPPSCHPEREQLLRNAKQSRRRRTPYGKGTACPLELFLKPVHSNARKERALDKLLLKLRPTDKVGIFGTAFHSRANGKTPLDDS